MQSLILLSEGVETNPGPTNTSNIQDLHICHWDLNSISADNSGIEISGYRSFRFRRGSLNGLTTEPFYRFRV